MSQRPATRSALAIGAALAWLGLAAFVGWQMQNLALASALFIAALVVLVIYCANWIRQRSRQADEAIAALRRSEARYEVAFAGSFQGLWDWDIQARSVHFSPLCKSLLGYETDQPVSELSAWTSRIHPDDRERVMAAMDDHLVHRLSFDQEFRLLAGVEQIRWVRARGLAIWNEQGFPVRMAGSLTDVSDRHRLEEELRQKVEDLASSNRALQEYIDAADAATRSKSESLANLSNDIRSPLAAVLGDAELLLEQSPAGVAHSLLERIKRNALQVLALVGPPAQEPPVEAEPARPALHDTVVAALPASPPAAMAQGSKSSSGEPAARTTKKKTLPLSGRRMLLAEDSPDNQWLITHHLQKSGAVVEHAGDGLQAVAKAQAAWQSGRPFHAVLMDMQMPVLDGYEATRRLRSAGYALPILAMTTHAAAADRQKCLAAGCDDYIAKPIRVPQLLAMLTACLQRLDVAGRDTQPAVGSPL